MRRLHPHWAAPVAIAVACAVTPALVPAQSTATQIGEGTQQELDEVRVTASFSPVIGVARGERSTRSRSTITHAHLATQPAGQSVAQSLNLVPGVVFTGSDAYGGGGGNLRMRSFDGSRIAMMLDGIPLNDSGNYAIYTGQLPDPEIIALAAVSPGTTDVDSPTASATGGTIHILTSRPGATPAMTLRPSLGSDAFRRLFVRGETGAFGPWDTTAYATFSIQQYDKFKGPGNLQRQQVNARLHQDLGAGDFLSLAVHYNRGRNHFYRSATAEQLRLHGRGFDHDDTCRRPAAEGGTVQDESDPAHSCANYYQVRVNPSDTGNLRVQASFGLTRHLRLTFDPSFQSVLANGGGHTVVAEDDLRLRADPALLGVDLNGDGDLLDRIALYTPNNTDTRRLGLNAALLWEVAPGSRMRLAYTFDRARHRQTGEAGWFGPDGDPQNVFAGRRGEAVPAAGGTVLRRRDRSSIALLNQISLAFSGTYLNERLRLDFGLRAPFFARRLDQYCHTPVANPGGDAWCTTQTEAAAPDAAGHVVLTGSGDARFVPPYRGTQRDGALLPGIGIALHPEGGASHLHAHYARGFSAPRNDNLYGLQIIDVQPETTDTFEVGYRHHGHTLLASGAIWKTHFVNRIISAWDDAQGILTDRNVGTVKLWGVDAAAEFELRPGLRIYGNAAYVQSEVTQDVRLGAGTLAPTAGKSLVDTPALTVAARLQVEHAGFVAGLQGRHVGSRWANDINTEKVGAFMLFDFDASRAFTLHGRPVSMQINVLNLFDRPRIGAVSTSIAGAARHAVGPPRTVQLTWTLTLDGPGRARRTTPRAPAATL